MKIIKCVDLTKTYDNDKVYALHNLNIEVEKNSIYGFLGPNGAGKTTTVKILTGLMKPTSGEFFIAGLPNNFSSIELKQKIGYLSQEPRMYSGMKAKELLIFVGKIFKQSKTESLNRADELLEMSGLTSDANKKISAFSGGMVQRLGIAQALMGNPEVLFLDEPTSALDPIGRKEVLEFINNLRKSCTVFMSSHILSDIERVCDTVAIINKGKLIVQEDTHELRKRFSDKIIEICFTEKNSAQVFIDKFKSVNLGEIIIQDDRKISIHPQNIGNDKIELLKLIAANNLEIDKFEIKTANLEDVFVKLIGGKGNG